MGLEVEVKFLVTAFDELREKLLDIGAVLHKPRVFEQNIVFDTPDGMLFSQMKLLRLRQDTAVTLTFKGKAPEGTVSEVKVREEIEVQISDFDTFSTILGRIGFQPSITYEKYRETYRLNGTEVVLDELPYGNFMEIEGEERVIKETAVALNLDWNKRIVSNYLAMMREVKNQFSLPFDDLTFTNFAQYPEAHY